MTLSEKTYTERRALIFRWDRTAAKRTRIEVVRDTPSNVSAALRESATEYLFTGRRTIGNIFPEVTAIGGIGEGWGDGQDGKHWDDGELHRKNGKIWMRLEELNVVELHLSIQPRIYTLARSLGGSRVRSTCTPQEHFRRKFLVPISYID
jgi:hypothetical protein